MRSDRLHRWREAHERARGWLLAERGDRPYWLGRLADSALATATAISALAVADRQRYAAEIDAGADWLTANRNADGGWGDTPESISNLPASLLAAGAMLLAGRAAGDAAEGYITRAGGPAAIAGLYGADRTFSVPILTHAAIAGLADWADVPPLPMELAALPRRAFRWVRMSVVSYALPALIAIGLAGHVNRPPRSRLLRVIRRAVTPRLLRRLTAIQPESGGFLEAAPLTSFVAMSLVAAGVAEHPVVAKALAFLLGSRRTGGAWPIDENLSVWLTTLATGALAGGEPATRQWLLERQQRTAHPYTGAAAGGWGWSHLPGSVPDADDTAGAMLALGRLGGGEATTAAAGAGAKWLLGLQNRDGGWPTFCRGWGRLDFDRSGCDLTAHVLRALHRWRGELPARPARRIGRAIAGGLAYLARTQRPDGAWPALWFGSQHTDDQTNPVFGTARVLLAYRNLGAGDSPPARAGRAFLLASADPRGGWGAAAGAPTTIEETAAAIEALTGAEGLEDASTVTVGVDALCERIAAGGLGEASPIGLYFARLWYHERLYPAIMATGALRAVVAAAEKGRISQP